MNIWSLRKDPQLKSLLLLLVEHLGESDWAIDPAYKTSPEAVYLCHREDTELRAYLHRHGQPRGRVGLHLEYPREAGGSPLYDAYDNLTTSQLIDMLAAHFGISRVKPLLRRSGE